MVINRSFHLLILLTLMFSACATNQVGETTAPIPLAQADCVKLVVSGDWPTISKHIDFCKNYKNSEGISPLMMSAYKNQREIFQNLIDAGSDVHAIDHSGSDALFYAVNFQRTNMVKILREKGAKITMNDFKVNALWVALQRSNTEMIRSINPTKEEVNIKGEDGWTALYFAIRREEKEAFDLILAAGAETNIKDSEGASPYLFAKDEVKWDYAAKKLAALTSPEFKKKN